MALVQEVNFFIDLNYMLLNRKIGKIMNEITNKRLWLLCLELSEIVFTYKNDYDDLLGRYEEKNFCVQLYRYYLNDSILQSEINSLIKALKERPWESDSMSQHKKRIITSIVKKLES